MRMKEDKDHDDIVLSRTSSPSPLMKGMNIHTYTISHLGLGDVPGRCWTSLSYWLWKTQNEGLWGSPHGFPVKIWLLERFACPQNNGFSPEKMRHPQRSEKIMFKFKSLFWRGHVGLPECTSKISETCSLQKFVLSGYPGWDFKKDGNNHWSRSLPVDRWRVSFNAIVIVGEISEPGCF